MLFCKVTLKKGIDRLYITLLRKKSVFSQPLTVLLIIVEVVNGVRKEFAPPVVEHQKNPGLNRVKRKCCSAKLR